MPPSRHSDVARIATRYLAPLPSTRIPVAVAQVRGNEIDLARFSPGEAAGGAVLDAGEAGNVLNIVEQVAGEGYPEIHEQHRKKAAGAHLRFNPS